MSLQLFLEEKFKAWKPMPPEVTERTKYSITLEYCQQDEPFGFLGDSLLYRIELKNKLPPWIVVYSGGKTNKIIDNLPPRHPHKFRLRVILRSNAVPILAAKALQHYGDEKTIREKIKDMNDENKTIEVSSIKTSGEKAPECNGGVGGKTGNNCEEVPNMEGNECGEYLKCIENKESETNKDINDKGDKLIKSKRSEQQKNWLESSWSDETWTNTDTDGSSNICFCMAVRCGYIKQVQMMLEERPELIGIVSSSNGFTPLATAVRRGDINTVRCLVTAGAELDQPSASGQTALHLAVLQGDVAMAQLLLDSGADFKARDLNYMCAEHYAVDSGSLDMVRMILDRGDVHAKDNNGWTPLFRALCQGASIEMIEELVAQGSDIDMSDHAGLPLASVARILKDRGRGRESVLRLVDRQYPHEKALSNFTRLTKKIYHVQSVFK